MGLASFWKIRGLTWANSLASYVLWAMVAFLTDVWRLNYHNAAMGINVFWGLVDLAPLFTQYVIDSSMGNYKMALGSSIFYTTGLLFLSLSALGTCDEDKVSCHVKRRYKSLFYLALPQLLIGVSFHKLNTIIELLSEEEKDRRRLNSSELIELPINEQGSRSRPNSTHEELAVEEEDSRPRSSNSTRDLPRQEEGSRSIPNSNEERIPREEVASSRSKPIYKYYDIGREEDGSISRPFKWFRFFDKFFLIVISLVGGFGLPNIKKWTLRFGIPTMCMFVATLFFVSGSYSNKKFKARGSFLTTICSVVLASFSRSTIDSRNQEYDHHSTTYYGHDRLRWLDRGITSLTNNNIDEEQRSTRMIRNIEETKKAICRIPFCMSFFILGIVSSVGETYFIEQANNMDNMVGRYAVPLVVLQVCYSLSKNTMKILYVAIIRKLLHFDINSNNSHDVVSSRYAGCVGTAVSMVFAILCCFSASDVEKRRLDVVKDMYRLHGTNYQGKIPMNMFWLVPQFFLLGSFDGILSKSIDLFFNNQAQTPQDRVMGLFSTAIIGLGKIGTLLLVFVFRKASAWGDNTSWFVENLNDSRLDKYYFVLAAFSIGNLIYYIIFYYYTSFRSEAREIQIN